MRCCSDFIDYDVGETCYLCGKKVTPKERFEYYFNNKWHVVEEESTAKYMAKYLGSKVRKIVIN